MGLYKPPSAGLNGIDRTIEIKMSKSDPDSSIFMLNSPAEVKRKIDKAYCPPQQIIENPILEYCKYIIFELIEVFEIKRPEKYGGDVKYSSYAELEQDFAMGNLNPPDLKPAVVKYINQFLAPVIEHFENDEHAKELYQFVQDEYKKYKSNEN
jgi:tyrosyl-tRNA synthetase